MIKPENPPAFPGQPRGSDGMPCGDFMQGMALRDWFAGQALTGLACSFARVEKRGKETPAQADARWSYERADAFLAERERQP